jgi:catechol 2,3-dioxygenase-like lactoylglutathione lyase family enzyme
MKDAGERPVPGRAGESAVRGILETALYVADPDRSSDFYHGLFAFEEIVRSDRLVALDVAGREVLLLFRRGATSVPIETEEGTIPPHDAEGRVHLAFAVDSPDLEPWIARLASRAIPIESRMRWPDGGESLYFRDPDGHLVELATRGTWPTIW